MNLTSVTLHSSGDFEDVQFSVREEMGASRYTIRSMVGLDAEELIPKFYGRGLESAAKFYEFTMKPRDVVIRVKLNPRYHINETVSQIRDKLYKLIASSRTGEIQLQFNSGATLVSAISGRVTKFEVAYFTRTPELQITVHCPDPTPRSIHPIDILDSGAPSANPVSLPDSASTAPHGLSFKVKFTAAVASFVIQDAASSPDWQFVVTPSGGFEIDDELWFSSEFANKMVYLERAVDPIHIMDKVSADSVWPLIFPGGNDLYFMQIDDFDWLELNYYSAYWGV